ncbi:MAG TPA: hypothetical protein VF921_13270 [Vicinamibacterales bacterium]
MSYNVTLWCGCSVYVSCHPTTRLVHTRIVEVRGPACPVRNHDVGARLWLWELLPAPGELSRDARHLGARHDGARGIPHRADDGAAVELGEGGGRRRKEQTHTQRNHSHASTSKKGRQIVAGSVSARYDEPTTTALNRRERETGSRERERIGLGRRDGSNGEPAGAR